MRLWKIGKQEVYVKIYVIYENIKSELVPIIEFLFTLKCFASSKNLYISYTKSPA